VRSSKTFQICAMNASSCDSKNVSWQLAYWFFHWKALVPLAIWSLASLFVICSVSLQRISILLDDLRLIAESYLLSNELSFSGELSKCCRCVNWRGTSVDCTTFIK
jgi:hypothetical protein